MIGANEIISMESILYDRNLQKQSEEGENQDDYKEILEKIIQLITNNHSAELAESLNSADASHRLKNLISKYLVSEKLAANAADRGNISDLTDKIYQDMAGISYVEKYLKNPEVEEININGKYGTWVVFSDGKQLTNEKFNTSEECVNIIKKMARMGNLILDGSSPIGDSYLSKGVRMSGAISPVVDEENGGIASIRKQKPASITRDKLIEYGTASADELEFLSLCINNGISLAIAGSTGSGKTADMGILLNTIDEDTRIISIEDTKELQIAKYDNNGKMINDVVQLYTKESPQAVTMDDHLRLSLRLHPDIIVPAEMRGKEAKTAIEAGRTGHTIISSLHANGAINAYDRILTMCLMADTTLSEERQLKMVIEAFPIILFKKQLKDNSRKYIEIFEATGVKDGDVIGNSIFKFITNYTEKKHNKIIKIHGTHQKVGGISEKLAETLRLNGVDEDVISKFTKNQIGRS